MTNNRLLSVSLFFGLSLSIASCANINDSKKDKQLIYQDFITAEKLEPLKKITSFHFYDWRSLDNQNLIISTTGNRPYLLTLSNYCVDLNYANAIIVNSTGSILQAKFDSITPVRHHGGKCLIESIYKISRDQADQLSALRKSKKPVDEPQSSGT